MKKINQVVLLLFLVIGLYSCSSFGLEKEYLPVSQEYLDYSIFPKGTYWIYQDSLTKAFDSVYVKDVSVRKNSHNELLSSTSANITYDDYSMDIVKIFLEVEEEHKGFTTLSKKGEYYEYYSFPFYNPFLIKNGKWNSTGQKTNLMNIRGKEYSEVIKQVSHNVTYYFAPKIGLIKREERVSNDKIKVWELVRYQLSNEPIKEY